MKRRFIDVFKAGAKQEKKNREDRIRNSPPPAEEPR